MCTTSSANTSITCYISFSMCGKTWMPMSLQVGTQSFSIFHILSIVSPKSTVKRWPIASHLGVSSKKSVCSVKAVTSNHRHSKSLVCQASTISPSTRSFDYNLVNHIDLTSLLRQNSVPRRLTTVSMVTCTSCTRTTSKSLSNTTFVTQTSSST